MSEELIRQLMAAGLSKSQATSVTAETLVNLFMDEDSKILIHEAKQQVSEMQNLVSNLRDDYDEYKARIENLSDAVLTIKEAQDNYGTLSDEKAKTVLALYSALLSLNMKAGADPSESVKDAGYILYAYLGGQAKRDICYSTESNVNDPL